MAEAAVAVIDALADKAKSGELRDDAAVLLAVYAYLQIVREPEPEKVSGSVRNGP